MSTDVITTRKGRSLPDRHAGPAAWACADGAEASGMRPACRTEQRPSKTSSVADAVACAYLAGSLPTVRRAASGS